jgi:iron complex outermembrane recepter protein
MNMQRKMMTALRIGAAAGALAVAAPAWAQPDTAEPPATAADPLVDETVAGGDQEVVVTARRREERLLDVPVAITAYSGEQLEAVGAQDITEIAETTPNVTLEASRGTNSTLTAFIRGVGQQDPVAGFEAGVGIYIDDVYLNRPQAALLDIYDIERIEVLRGPQGTLYGRNTIGGAIKYVTRRLPDTPNLRVRGTLGNYDQADLVVGVSTPIGDPNYRVGVTGARLSRGGFGTNLTTGLDNYNRDIWAGRATLEIEPSDRFFVRLSGDMTRDYSLPRGGHRLIPGLVSNTPVLANEFDTRGRLLDPEQRVESQGASLYIQAEPTDWLTLRSITALRSDESGTPIDFDALPAVDVDVPAVYENEQFSQELQALVNVGGFNGLLGFYYLDANAVTIFDVRLPNTVTALTFGDVDTETYAIFGDFSYDFSPQFSVSVGGRYTWDRRRSDILRQVFIGGGSPFFGGTGTLFALQSDFEGEADFEEFTPRVSVSFRPNEDMNIYASYSRGFKGGGFDPRGVSTACRNPTGGACNPQQLFDFMSFDPETVDSYELGWRAQLFDRRLNFSLVGFYADYQDIQIPGSFGTVLNGQQTFIGITTNAAGATFTGVEFEGNAVLARDFATPGDRLNLSFSLGYLDARFDEYIDARGINVADRRAIQNTPDFTGSLTLNYGLPVGAGTLNIIPSVSYRGDSQQFELPIPLLDQEGYALFDLSLVWRSDNDRYSIGLHAKNIFDERYIVSGYNFLRQNPDTGAFILANGQPGFSSTLGAEGILTAFYGNPAQVFLTVGLNFR